MIPRRRMRTLRRVCALVLTLSTLITGSACKPTPPSSESEVIVYASQDQVYAEPILQKFQADTGIQVRSVFDSEAVKTVGLANRLLAEKARPAADVFWNNEMLRTIQLSTAGVLHHPPLQLVFGSRSRRIVIHKGKMTLPEAPRDWMDLTNAQWKGRIALAYPLFGTTATHFLYWRERWGHDAWTNWCKALLANQPFLVEGNSAVVQLVGRGEAWIGMTDSDDIAAGQRNGYPIEALPESASGLRIPNSVSQVVGAPHPRNAQALLDYLSRPATIQTLVQQGALETAEVAPPGPPSPVPWDELERNRASGTEALRSLFLR